VFFRTYSRKKITNQPQTPLVAPQPTPESAVQQTIGQPYPHQVPANSGDFVPLVPPNRSTLVGMRGLLLSLDRFKQVTTIFSLFNFKPFYTVKVFCKNVGEKTYYATSTDAVALAALGEVTQIGPILCACNITQGG
jgi:hypothetical protein